MSDNIIINSTPNKITVTEQVNSITISSPGPQGPAGVMIISQIPTISPIINTGSSIAFDQIAQYIVLDTRYAKITGSVQYSASSGSAQYAINSGSTLQTNFNTLTLSGSSVATQEYVIANVPASAIYSSSAGYATNSGSSIYSDLSASTSQTNFYTLYIAGSAVATQEYVNNASVLFAVLSSSAQYASSAGYASLSSSAINATHATTSGSSDYATNSGSSTYSTTSSSAGYSTNSGSSDFATNSGSAEYSTNSGSSDYSTNSGSATYSTNSSSALYSTSAGNSNTTSQTNFNPLTISGSSVATEDYVNSQDFQKSTGSVAYATNSGSSDYATNSGNSLTTSQTSFNNLNVTGSTTSMNPSTGALIVGGGTGIGGDLNVFGNINVTGSAFFGGSAIYVSASELVISDPLIYLAEGNVGNVWDIGFVGNFTPTASAYQHTGLVRDHGDGKWKLFSGVVPEPTNTVDFASATYDTLKLGSIEISSSAQVSNLNAQYLSDIGSASYARLDQAQDFVGRQTFGGSQGKANFDGVYGGLTIRSNISASSANTSLIVNPGYAGGVGQIIRGFASQTGNLQEWQSSSATILAVINNGGGIATSNRLAVGYTGTQSGVRAIINNNGSITDTVLIAKGSASQTGNLQEWQNSDSTILARVNNFGEIVTSTTVYANGIQNNTGFWSINNNGVAQFTARNATNIPLTLKGSASQTANLQEWQNSLGASVTVIDFAGTIKTSRVGNSFGNVTGGVAWGGHIPVIEVRANSSTNSGLNIFTNSAPIIRAYDSSGNARGAWNNDGSIVMGPSNIKLGTLSVYADASVNIGAVIRGSDSQTANLLEWQTASSVILGAISANGSIINYGANLFQSFIPSRIPLTLKGSASQTANLQEWQEATTTPSFVNSTGQFRIRSFASNFGFTALGVSAGDATEIGIAVRGQASQIADLQQWQNSGASIIAGVNANGYIYTGSTIPVTNQAGTSQGQLSAVSSASNVIPLIVRRPSTGNVNSFEVQTSIGQPYVYVDQNMVLYSLAAFNAKPSTIDGTSITAYPTSSNHRGDIIKITDSTQTVTRAAFNAIGQIYSGSPQPTLTTVSTISSINASGVFASVTTTTSSNNLSIGQIVYVTGAAPSEYNGNFYVNAIISSSSFLVSKSNAFVTSSATTPGTLSLPPQLSIVTPSANVSGISIQGKAGQQGNLLEFRNSSGTVVSNVIGNGDWVVPNLYNNYMAVGTGYAYYAGGITNLFVINGSGSRVGAIFRQRTNTANTDLTQWQTNSAPTDFTTGTTVAGVTASGQIYTGSSSPLTISTIPAQLSVKSSASNVTTILTQAAIGQTANAIEVLNQDATPAFRVRAGGNIGMGSLITGVAFGLNMNQQGAGIIGQITRGYLNQTADLHQFQDSNANILAGVTGSGRIYTGSAGPVIAAIAYGGSAAQLGVAYSASTPGLILKPSNFADGVTNSFEIYSSSTATSPSTFFNKFGQATLAGLSVTGNLGANSSNNNSFLRALASTSASASLVIGRSSVGQAADMLQLQNNSTSALFAVTAGGRLIINIPNGTQFSTASAMIDIQTSSSVTPGIIIKTSASQTSTAYPLEIEDSTGATKSYLSTSGGGLFTAQLSATSALTAGTQNYLTAALSVIPLNDSVFGAVIKRFSASQTADLMQFQSSTGGVLSKFDSLGQYTGIYSILVSDAPTTIPLRLKGSASQTANLQEWQNSSGSVIASISASGTLYATMIDGGSA